MEPFEKEQLLYDGLHDFINCFLLENNLTYFQVIGMLDMIKNDFTEEFKNLTFEIEEEGEE